MSGTKPEIQPADENPYLLEQNGDLRELHEQWRGVLTQLGEDTRSAVGNGGIWDHDAAQSIIVALEGKRNLSSALNHVAWVHYRDRGQQAEALRAMAKYVLDQGFDN